MRHKSPVWRMFREQPFTVPKRFPGKRGGADKFRERLAFALPSGARDRPRSLSVPIPVAGSVTARREP